MSMSELQRASFQAKSSPIKRSTQGSHAFSAGPPPNASENRKQMEEEMKGLWVGPMPVQEFLDDFLPTDKVQGVKVAPQLPNYFDRIHKTKVEREMYGEFIKLVHEENLNLIPGFKFIDTSNHPDHESRDGKKIKPDPTMYKETVDTSKNVTQFGELELNIEFKTDTSHEPFDDIQKPGGSFETMTCKGRDCRGQLTNYATEWCSRQHRLFAFSIFISDPYVRFIRWDRSGAIVSERFDFRTNSQPLIDFLWRFARLENDALRGKDETVRLANEEEIKLAHEHLSDWAQDKKRPVVVLRIGDREFIAWGSMSDAESLTGRATRAYPVYEKATKLRMFLKDTWRAVTLEKESEILKKLNFKEVRNVPTFVCGGDIDHHVTLSDLYGAEDPLPDSSEALDHNTEASEAREPNSDGDDTTATANSPTYATSPIPQRKLWKVGTHILVQRVHHRFTEDIIGKPLQSFVSAKEMMSAAYDAYIAHYDALRLCNILHRDISIKNILLCNGVGILNDWDLAKTVGSKGARRHERTGTWQFISTHNLENPGKIHTVQDDMESFVLVVLYIILRHLPHNHVGNLTAIMKNVFDSYALNDDGTAVGGGEKGRMFTLRKWVTIDFKVIDNPPMTRWAFFAISAVGQWHKYLEDQLPRQPCDSTDEFESDYHLDSDVSSTPVLLLENMAFQDHEALRRVWDAVLKRTDWPSQHIVIDHFNKSSLSKMKSSGKRPRDQAGTGVADLPEAKKMKSSENAVFVG